MNHAFRTTNSDDVLKETALRLIKALGVEGAIFVCRSNYWHGVLRLIEGGRIGPKAA
ncbi:MAG: hypothetical protein ACR2RA_00295 [Geminicoccaceae bacterium]